MPRRTLVVMGVALPLWVPIAVAAIASAGVLVAATLTAYATARRERDARRVAHESERLEELLAAALELREAAFSEPAEDRWRLERARSSFVVRRKAVPVPRIRELALRWEGALRNAPSDAAEPDEEQLAWLAFLESIGRACRSAF